MAHSSNNNNNNPQRDGDDNRHHHPRQGSPPRMQRLNEAAAVERTSIPEQHNDLLLPESDDDSQCPMAASWSTVTTYGGIPPSERSRKLIGLITCELHLCMNSTHSCSYITIVPSPRRGSSEQCLVRLWRVRWFWSGQYLSRLLICRKAMVSRLAQQSKPTTAITKRPTCRLCFWEFLLRSRWI